jgi:hypothetical protein
MEHILYHKNKKFFLHYDIKHLHLGAQKQLAIRAENACAALLRVKSSSDSFYDLKKNILLSQS